MQKGFSKSMMLGAMLILLAGGYLFIQSNNTTEDVVVEQDTTTTDSGMVEKDDAMMEEGAMEVTVEGGSFYFDPNTIEAKVGQPVTITFENVEGFHDIDIDEFDVDTDPVQEGDTITVAFTPDQVGEFEYYCSVGNHRAEGMWGTLIVTE